MAVYIHKDVKSFHIPVDGSIEGIRFARTPEHDRYIAEGHRVWILQAEPHIETLILAQVPLSGRSESDVPMTQDEKREDAATSRATQAKADNVLRAMVQTAASIAAGQPVGA